MDDAVTQELARIRDRYIEKRADVLEHIQSYLAANPEAQTALIGAGVGGLGGLAHSYMQPKSQRTTVSNMLTGAGLGAAAGGLGHLAHSAYGQAREAPRPVDVGGQTYHLPREALRDQGFIQELGNLREPSLASRAVDWLGRGLNTAWDNKAVVGGLAAGEGIHQALSSRSLPFLGKGLGDTWLQLGRTTRAPRGVSDIFEGLKSLKADSNQLFGPTRESTLASWRQLAEGDPQWARSAYGLKGQGPLSNVDIVRALKREVKNPKIITHPFRPASLGQLDAITPSTLDSLADVGGRLAGATLDDKGAVKLPATAPPKFNFFGRKTYAPRLGGMGMRLGLLGTGAVGGLAAQDYFDTAARERALKELLAKNIIVGDS